MYWQARALIEAAQISAEEYRAAQRMLDIAEQNNGHLRLDREEACALFQVTSWPSVRRMLNHLSEQGVITHHTNNCAYVWFPCYGQPRTTGSPAHTTGAAETVDNSQPRTGCAPARTTGAAVDNSPRTGCADRAPDDHQRAPGDHQRAPGARTNMLVSTLDLTTTESENELTNTAQPQAPGSDEAARSYGLLTDPAVGIDKVTARRFASQHRFAYLMKQVCEWQREMAAGKVRSNGALVKRISKGFGASLVPSDRASPIYLRHVPADERQEGETEEDRRRKYIPDEFADIIIG